MQKDILLSGGTGLIGRALRKMLAQEGRDCRLLLRHPLHAEAENLSWNPDAGLIEDERLGGFKAVVHLAGEPIAARRWTPEQKQKIRDSRVKGTRLLAERLARCPEKPEVLLCASAIGFYGNRGDEVLTEASDGGSGFLAEVTQEWEAAAQAAKEAGIRVVHARFGIVLSKDGGALAKMLPAFQLGLGGPLGDGSAYMSWISIDDTAAALQHLLSDPEAEGVYNLTAPDPVPNRDFVKAMGKALHRPAFLPAPAFALRGLLGEMGETLLLHSARVLPKRLEAQGFTFRHPELLPALQDLCHRIQ